MRIYRAVNCGFQCYGVHLSRGLVNASNAWVLCFEFGNFHITITNGEKIDWYAGEDRERAARRENEPF